MPEYLLIGLKKIHGMLIDDEGVEAISFSTFKQNYVPDMQRLGVIFNFRVGRTKDRTNCCAWPSQVKLYFTKLQQNKYDKKISP